MSISALAVRRPIGTLMIYVAVLLLGAVGLRELAIDLLPEVDSPRITVTCAYEGVAPQDIETQLTRRIEQAVASVDGLQRIESTSIEGLARVQLQFLWGMDLEEAVNEVRAQLDRIRPLLPEGAEAPMVLKFDLSSAAVAQLGVSGRGDARRLRYLAQEDIARRLEAVSGVANVDVRGGRVREIRVELSRERLAALEIDVEDVSATLARENRNVSAGDMLQGGQEVVIRTEGEYRTLEQIGETVIARRRGRGVQLHEIATVRDGVQEVRDDLWIDDEPGIRLIIRKQSGRNTIEVVRALREEIAQINADYGGAVQLSMLRDTGKFVEDAVAAVQTAAVLGGVLAVLVLLVFLRDVRATLVVATAIPISVMATLALMYFADITLNLISFGGLALGLGMLVDNAIVVLESVFAKHESGRPAVDAAIEGTREVAGAVVAGTLTTVAVFVPVVFVGGFAGVFFRQMAIVVSFSLACSLAVALTLVPTMAAHVMRPRRKAAGPGPVARTYARMIEAVLVRPTAIVVLGVLAFGTSLLFVPRVGTELMPEPDEGRLQVSVELPVGTPLLVTSATVREIAARIRSELGPEEIEHLVLVAGPENWWRPAGSNKGSVDVLLTPAAHRIRDQSQIMTVLSEALRDVAGAEIRVRPESGNLLLRMMRGGGDDRLTVDVLGHDIIAAEALASQIRARAAALDGVTYTRVDRELGQLERSLVIDRTRLAELGIGAGDVAATIEHYVLGKVATRYRDRGDEYDLRVVLQKTDRARIEQLRDLPVALPDGGTVALQQVARIEERIGPSSLAREDQRRILKVGVGIGDRDLGSIVADLEPVLAEVATPEGFDVRIGGEYREQQSTFGRLFVGALLALFLVYTVLAVLFESLRGPLVVMTATPFAFIGVLAVLLATNTTLNMNSALGMIVLIGIVVNNAIVLLDHIGQLRRDHGVDLVPAIREGAARRLRPVLMTSFTTILGMLPLAIGLGEGSELQTPLARAVVGGLTSATAITLLFVPALYLILERRRSS